MSGGEHRMRQGTVGVADLISDYTHWWAYRVVEVLYRKYPPVSATTDTVWSRFGLYQSVQRRWMDKHVERVAAATHQVRPGAVSVEQVVYRCRMDDLAHQRQDVIRKECGR